jgi:ankyrin repeat protein
MSKPTPGDLKIALNNLPRGKQGLDNTYEQAMERIQGQEADFQKLASQVLSWVVHARRPLSSRELQHALGTRIGMSELDDDFLPEPEDLVSVCAGLVTIDEESNIVRLVHYTTQEYFERTQKDWFPDAAADVTIICVTYLSFSVFKSGFCHTDDEFEERLQSYQFFDYATHNWGHHAREASTLSQAVVDFLDSKANVEASSQGLLATKRYLSHSNYSQELPRQITGLHLAAYFGVKEAINALLKKGIQADSNDNNGRTPLSWAALEGQASVVQQLLETGTVETDSKDSDGRTPLSFAAEGGQEAVVQLLLLTEKVDADSKATGENAGRTSLSFAAEGGHEAVVQLLLTEKVDADSKATGKHVGWTPLLFAAKRGHKDVVRLLLAEKVDAESKATGENAGRTPLSFAAELGREDVVQLLLAEKVDAESKATERYNAGRTPLSFAAGRGHEAVVMLLLEEGAELECKDTLYSHTPLSWAAKYGHEAVVRLLLEKGANLNSLDKYERTPLWLSAKYGHEAVVKLLFEKGANLNSPDKYGQTPFSWAAEYRHEAVMQLLLEKGAHVNAKDGDERTVNDYGVLFVAVSLFDFNIDSNHRQGFPYHMYVPGEVFDVIDEVGELWLAINQNDPQRKAGWLWEKHFARMAP